MECWGYPYLPKAGTVPDLRCLVAREVGSVVQADSVVGIVGQPCTPGSLWQKGKSSLQYCSSSTEAIDFP